MLFLPFSSFQEQKVKPKITWPEPRSCLLTLMYSFSRCGSRSAVLYAERPAQHSAGQEEWKELPHFRGERRHRLRKSAHVLPVARRSQWHGQVCVAKWHPTWEQRKRMVWCHLRARAVWGPRSSVLCLCTRHQSWLGGLIFHMPPTHLVLRRVGHSTGAAAGVVSPPVPPGTSRRRLVWISSHLPRRPSLLGYYLMVLDQEIPD